MFPRPAPHVAPRPPTARSPRVFALALTVATLVSVAGLIAACGRADLDPNLGGDTTRADASRNSFGLPAPGLTNEERRLFERGDSFFTKNWVTAPASTDARDGLGPTFNGQACSSCHVLDGRGIPPEGRSEGGDVSDDEDNPNSNLGLLLRLSIPGEDPTTGSPVPDPAYGGQLQDRAILGVEPEGSVEVTYAIVDGTYADGTPYELRSPTYRIVDERYGPLHPDLLVSPRLAPQVMGVGLLEAVPEATIEALADPDDADGDGVSGRVNQVWSPSADAKVLGRFGWKANVATVEDQVAGAFHGDIGITSSLHPDENCPAVQLACAAAPNGENPTDDGSTEPELTDERLAAVTFYNRTLSVPAMRNVDDSDVTAGAEIFDSIGCSSCHVPSLETGDAAPEVLANQTIYPYTDLLLHDMGTGLADDRPDFEATGSEWRTPPLWGLGLIDDVNGERFLLHDGRARTIAEAILWHGGEARPSSEAFRQLSADERAQLEAFLESL